MRDRKPMEEASLAETRIPRLSVIIPTLNEADYLALLPGEVPV